VSDPSTPPESGPSGVVRVLLVDDHPVVREGLRGLLAAEVDLEVVGEAGDGEVAVRLAMDLLPDVVLMDLRMPGTDGVAATSRITRELPGVRVLVLTTYDTDGDILRAVEAGATGYLLKDTPAAQLTAAVRAASRGETVLAPPVAARLVSRMRAPAPTELTPREREVLVEVARGFTNAEIGRVLFIGEATVKTHLLRVFAKLDVDDRTRAVTRAMELGIVAAPDDGEHRASRVAGPEPPPRSPRQTPLKCRRSCGLTATPTYPGEETGLGCFVDCLRSISFHSGRSPGTRVAVR
jgi:DNA-binding NarL/FixJ family response regulator